MAERVVLHIGAMKSGTSFIQSMLRTNKSALRKHGVLYPGRNKAQVRAAIDILGQSRDGQRPEGAWKKLVDRIDAWPGTAVVSMEFFGPAKQPAATRVLESLAPADVQVVLTARDLGRNVPAMWQEWVQNGSTLSWQEYLSAVAAEDLDAPGPSRTFWRHQGIATIARRWSRLVGRDHFTLVTVPPQGAPGDLLWQRFAGVLGVDSLAWTPAKRSNPSLGAASTLVLQAVNARMAGDPLTPAAYNALVKHRLAKGGLAGRRAVEPRLALDDEWVRRRGQQMVDRLDGLDLRVVGSLDDLVPQTVSGVDVADVSDRDQLDAAVDALAYLLRLWPTAQRTQPTDE